MATKAATANPIEEAEAAQEAQEVQQLAASVTMADVLAAKETAEDAINQIITDFSKQTGCQVAGIQNNAVYGNDGRIVVNRIQLEVRL